jgi:hypothetical protein
MRKDLAMRLIIAALTLFVLAGCTTTVGGRVHHGKGQIVSATANPVDLLHKLGVTTDDVQGSPSLDGARVATGWWGTDQYALDFPQAITIWMYPSRDDVEMALADVTPTDHEAVIQGDRWMAEVTTGHTNIFEPSPDAIASALAGEVVIVWP